VTELKKRLIGVKTKVYYKQKLKQRVFVSTPNSFARETGKNARICFSARAIDVLFCKIIIFVRFLTQGCYVSWIVWPHDGEFSIFFLLAFSFSSNAVTSVNYA